jgi:hypothetical protein
MSLIFELCKKTGKKVCPPNHVRTGNCPMIVRTTSEDLLTANVFGILKNLDANIWLPKFLGEAIKGRDFSKRTFENLSFEFWKKYRPPMNRKYGEGVSEVDLTISYKYGVIFIEAKYLAPVSLRTTNDRHRDQVIRYLDLAADHHLRYPGSVKEFYFVLIMDTRQPPGLIPKYRFPQNLIKGLSNPGFWGDKEKIADILSKGIGWLSWQQVKTVLEIAKGEFTTDVEKRFISDLVLYLDYKIREAERIRTERGQLGLW